MIDLSNVRREQTKTKIYAPMFFITNISKLMHAENIEHKTTSWRKLQNDVLSEDDRKQWEHKYAAIYHPTAHNAMGCIESTCNADDLFELSRKMISDADFTQDIKNMDNKADAYNQPQTRKPTISMVG